MVVTTDGSHQTDDSSTAKHDSWEIPAASPVCVSIGFAVDRRAAQLEETVSRAGGPGLDFEISTLTPTLQQWQRTPSVNGPANETQRSLELQLKHRLQHPYSTTGLVATTAFQALQQ